MQSTKIESKRPGLLHNETFLQFQKLKFFFISNFLIAFLSTIHDSVRQEECVKFAYWSCRFNANLRTSHICPLAIGANFRTFFLIFKGKNYFLLYKLKIFLKKFVSKKFSA